MDLIRNPDSRRQKSRKRVRKQFLYFELDIAAVLKASNPELGRNIKINFFL